MEVAETTQICRAPCRVVLYLGWDGRRPPAGGGILRVQVGDLSVEADRRRRRRIALGLAWATIAWNTVEAVVAIVVVGSQLIDRARRVRVGLDRRGAIGFGHRLADDAR